MIKQICKQGFRILFRVFVFAVFVPPFVILRLFSIVGELVMDVCEKANYMIQRIVGKMLIWCDRMTYNE